MFLDYRLNLLFDGINDKQISINSTGFVLFNDNSQYKVKFHAILVVATTISFLNRSKRKVLKIKPQIEITKFGKN